MFIDISYNRPQLCANATWNPYGIIWAGQGLLGNEPYGLFIDQRDIIYGLTYGTSVVHVWRRNSTIPIRNITGGLSNSESVFVASDDDVYVDNGAQSSKRRVDKWTTNSSSGTRVMNVTGACTGLFMDRTNNLYCAMWNKHRVIRAPMNGSVTTAVIVAGNGSAGSSSNLLNGPVGIFIDDDFNLFVADSQNDRIQRFSIGNLTGTTVLGVGIPTGASLNFPRSVILDADGNLYVADSSGHRIVRLGSDGFHSIIGCTGGSSNATNDLNEPATIAFDSLGNIFVMEKENDRLQLFELLVNSCGKLVSKLE